MKSIFITYAALAALAIVALAAETPTFSTSIQMISA